VVGWLHFCVGLVGGEYDLGIENGKEEKGFCYRGHGKESRLTDGDFRISIFHLLEERNQDAPFES
jgi:hypothetical protein